MAYSLASASKQYISGAGAPASGTPLTLAVMVYPTDNGTVSPTFFSLDKISGQQLFQLYRLQITDSPPLPLRAMAASGGTLPQASGGTISANSWNHAAGVYSSSTSRTAYANGTAGTANTTSVTPSGMDNVNIGVRWYTTLAEYFQGRVAEAAIWSAALTAAEIVSLNKGFRPYRIRPQSLVFYAPLLRNLQDLRAALALTNNASATVIEHPRVY